MRTALKVVGGVVLGLLVAVIVAVAGGWAYLRTPRGRDRVIALALTRLREHVPGGIKVARVEGDLTRGLVLHGVELDDRDGRLAIAIERLEVRYELRPLVTRRLIVQRLDASGVLVVSRPLADGRDGLATLFAPGPPGPPLESLPIAIDVEAAAIRGRVVRLPARGSLEHPPRDGELRAAITATASTSRALTVRVGSLVVDVTRPAQAHLVASGTLDLRDRPRLRNGALEADVDTRELRRRVEALRLEGPLGVTAAVEGPLDDLGVEARIAAPRDRARVAVRGRVGGDRVRVDALVVRLPATDLSAHGTLRFDGRLDAAVEAASTNLGTLARFGAPSLGGALSLRAHLRHDARAASLRLAASTTGLAVGTVRVRQAELDVDTVDLRGELHAWARGVRIGERALQQARLDVTAGDQLRVALDAEGPEQTSVQLRVHGTPRLRDGRVEGFDAVLDRLRLSIADLSIRELHPARVVASASPPSLRVDRIDLADRAEGRVALAGAVDERGIEHALVEVKHVDLDRLAPVLSPGHLLPHSDLYAIVQARGPFTDPEAHARLSGEVHGKGARDVIRLAGQIEAHLMHRRLTGEAFLTIGGQKARAHVDLPVPLRPDAPIEAHLDASVLLSPGLADAIAPKLLQFQPLAMFLVKGLFTAQARLTGTTSAPELHASARLAGWEAAGAHGGFGVSVEYAARELGGALTADFSALPAGGGSGGGRIEATARLPLDLDGVLGGRKAPLLAEDAPLHGLVKLEHVDVDHLPLRALGIAPPLQHGRLDGELAVGGTRSHPQATARLEAAGFQAVRLGLGPLQASMSAKLDGGVATADAVLALDGREALRAGATLAAPSVRSLGGGKLDARAEVVGLDLASLRLLRGLAGELHGAVRARGALPRPSVDGELEVTGLRLGDTTFARFTASGVLGTSRARASLDAEQPGGGRAEVRVDVPLAAGPIEARVRAERFVLDVEGERLPGVRLLRGRLDADLRLTGTAAAPRLDGTLAVRGGAVGVPATATTYREIDLDLKVDGRELRLDALRARAGREGEVTASASATLDGTAPSAVHLALRARRFPFQQRGITVLLDGDVDASGKRDASGGLSGKIRVAHGQAQLPDLQQTRVLHPTGALADVRFVGADAARDEGPKLRLGALLDGPFLVRGREVDAEARGAISLDLTGKEPILRGALRLGDGAWIELFGRRYDVERGRIAFDGGDDPLLDLRIARHTPSAVIGIDVNGRASAPRIEPWSSPPIYDRTQVLGIVLSGDPATTAVSAHGLERQALGAISNLVVTGIKQRFLPGLPIDVLRVDASRTSGADTGGSEIEVGKYLTESLYVGYAYQIGVERVGTRRANRNEARLTYRLAPKWQLEASGGDAGVGGLDLYWSLRR